MRVINIPSKRDCINELFSRYGIDRNRTEIINKLYKVIDFYNSDKCNEDNFSLEEYRNLFK